MPARAEGRNAMSDNTRTEYEEYEWMFEQHIQTEPEWYEDDYIQSSSIDWLSEQVAEKYGTTVANQFPDVEIAKLLNETRGNLHIALENIEYIIAHITLGNI